MAVVIWSGMTAAQLVLLWMGLTTPSEGIGVSLNVALAFVLHAVLTE